MSRISKWVVTAGMLALCLSLAAAQESKRAGDSADQATLDKLDVVHGRQDISIEITASTAVTPKVTTLKEPDRLVLDFPNTVPGTETRRIAVDREGVKSVRMGVNSDVPPTTRVVIDLEAARDYQLVPENNRFIVKFRNVPGAMTAAATVEKKPAPTVIPVAAKPTDAPVAKPASKPVDTAEPKQVASLTPTAIPAPAPNSTSSMPAPNSKSETAMATATPVPSSSSTMSSAKPKADPPPVQTTSAAPTQPKSSTPVMTASASKPASTSMPTTSTSAAQPSASTSPASAPAPAQAPSTAAAPKPTTVAAADPPANVPDTSKDDKSKVAPEMKKADYDPNTYIIGEQDVLGIDVWKERDISQTVVVRPDGKITIPLVDEVYVVGMTPLQLQTMLEEKLKPFLTVPQVTVIVKEISSRKVYLMGQVGRTGPFLINSTTTVLQLIAQAGGLRDFAKKKKIYIMRNVNGKTEQYRFNYDEVIKGKNLQQNIVLRPGDTIVVP